MKKKCNKKIISGSLILVQVKLPKKRNVTKHSKRLRKNDWDKKPFIYWQITTSVEKDQ
jgi:hypothetical protein